MNTTQLPEASHLVSGEVPHAEVHAPIHLSNSHPSILIYVTRGYFYLCPYTPREVRPYRLWRRVMVQPLSQSEGVCPLR